MSFITDLVSGRTKAATPRTFNNPAPAPNNGYAAATANAFANAGWTAQSVAAAQPVYQQPTQQAAAAPQQTSYAPQQSYGNDSGYGYTPAPEPPPDPFAKWGGEAAYNQYVKDYNTGKTATYGSITDRINGDSSQFGSGVMDYEESMAAGQKKLNGQGTQTELARAQGNAGVLDTVGTGLQSAGTLISTRGGASTSSAPEAIARAYAKVGQREMTKVGNQYAQGMNALKGNQEDFDAQNVTSLRHLTENKTTIVNGIVTAAQTAIAALNDKAASSSLPDRIDIESEKARIKGEALASLSKFDGQLVAAKQKNAPSSVDQNRISAEALRTAGTAATTPFEYTSQMPAQFAGTGPFASDLPLYALPNGAKRDERL